MREKITKEATKNLFSSGIAFAVATAYTILLICTVLSYMEEGSSLVVAVIMSIFSILLCAGMWMLYGSAKNSDKINTTGFTLIKVVAIVSLIEMIILGVILFVVGVVMTVIGFTTNASAIDISAIENTVDEALEVMYPSGGYTSIVNQYLFADGGESFFRLIGLVGAAFIIGGLFILVLMSIYYAFVLKAIKLIRGVVESKTPNSKFPMFVVVMLYILTVITAFGLLNAFTYILYGEIWSFLSKVATLVFYILVIVCINKYKDVMKEAEIKAAMINDTDADANIYPEDNNAL